MRPACFKDTALTILIGIFILMLGTGGAAWADDQVKLPANMHWSCYDVGSGGYIQASAIADGLLKKFDCRVRLIPSGTSIGRLFPLMAKRVSVGWPNPLALKQYKI